MCCRDQYLSNSHASRTAICRGAVFKGFLDGVCKGDLTTPSGGILDTPIMISSTVSRASFGNVFRVTFDATEHSEEDKVWSSNEHERKADNQMSWYLTRVGLAVIFLMATTN
jgi:hypothetical protein